MKQKPTKDEMPQAQVLVYEPDLTHSVWTDLRHKKRSRESLEKMLRKAVRSGEYVGYRLITVHSEHIGVSSDMSTTITKSTQP